MISKIEGVFLGNYQSSKGNNIGPIMVNIIKHLSNQQIKKYVRSFLRHLGLYSRFIKCFRKIFSTLFSLFVKDLYFFGHLSV